MCGRTNAGVRRVAEDAGARKASSRPLVQALKWGVTLALSAIVLGSADWSAIARSVRHADFAGIAVVFLCMALCVTISAYKWQLLLDIHGARYPFGVLHRWYFTAMFFNNFLPTSIGGDGYRVYKTWNNPRSRTSAVLAVFMERLSGILTLMLLGWLGALAGYFRHGNELAQLVAWIGLAGMAATLAVALLTRHPGIRAWCAERVRLPAVLREAFEHLGDYRRQPAQTLGVLLVTLGFHGFSLGLWWLLVRSLGGDIAPADLIVVLALLSVVTVIPISINGIGLVDGSFVYLAGSYGLNTDVGLATILAVRALLIPISLVGGWFYLRERGGNRPQGADFPMGGRG